MKKQRKEEKAKLKAAQMQYKLDCKENSSSSSESSDSECGEVVDMSRLKRTSLSQSQPNDHLPQSLPIETQVVTASTPMQPESFQSNTPSLADERVLEVRSTQSISGQIYCSTGNPTSASSIRNIGFNEVNSLVTNESTRKIEVCMGGKCKKSGAALLLEEFQKAVGGEGAVVGCKCMGKCRSAPNVKVLNSIDGIQAQVHDDSVRTPANPLCIGVGVEDVGSIVANFFGRNQTDLGLATAS